MGDSIEKKDKTILGLDLGITSIGWAHVIEGEDPSDSEIKQIGSRIIQFDNFEKVDKKGVVSESKNPEQDFVAGRGLSPNAGRTKRRGARRLLDRYKMRRKNLIEVLLNSNIISGETILVEDGKNTTHETWSLRSRAASERIELEDLARVLLSINKKRGYKSSRKTKKEEDGYSIDGMGIAKKLYDENITPGQFVFQQMKAGRTAIPDFYRSDLQTEFDKVWNFQKKFYPEILTSEFYVELQGKGQRATSAMFWSKYKFNTAETKQLDDSLKNIHTIKFHIRDQKKLQGYKWRSDGVSTQLKKEEMAYVITEINNNLNNSSGYLGAISDRSKELYFNNETVGQYLYKQLQNDFHISLKNQVFYRQDYLDEFETIWNTQAKYYPLLTDNLKEEIRDIVIFYQRKLKSQKGLISLCEFENKEIEIDGKLKTIGLRVAPKSSLLFQEFKIWQNLNNVLIRRSGSRKRVSKKDYQTSFLEEKDIFELNLEEKQLLFNELNLKGNLKSKSILELLGYSSKVWEINYTQLEGNLTNSALYNAYLKILEMEGYNEDLLKLSNKDIINVAELETSASEIKEMVKSIFEVLGINTEILEFNSELDGKEFEKQFSYQLWHLLYSAEDDSKKHSEDDILIYGNDNINLKKQLCAKFGFAPEHAKILANVSFQDDYCNLSTKAMREIYPYIKESKYSEACEYAGYRHSKHSLTKEELEKRELKSKLELLKKNSLRNPVVEKILNQLVNIVNALIDKENDALERAGKPRNFQFDEIRIELARELKKNAAERADMTININAANIAHEKIYKLLQSEFAIKNPTRNDIIRYKLYEELKGNGYKDLYTDTYIPREIIFSKLIDIEHVIPQSKLFDDSFSNKTIVYRKDNLEKGNMTAIDYIDARYGEEGLGKFVERIEKLFEIGIKNKEEGITKAKYLKLLKRESEIGDGFIERDLRDSQYIAKKAKEMLFEITRSVISTSGRITNRLREDWGLINVMKEINLPKYRSLGLTEMEERKYGQQIEMIKDWTKRNDHRHHAMDALTVAFTKHSHIQYLNYLNARRNEKHKLHGNIVAIETKETEIKVEDNGNKKRVFKEPIPNFRHLAKAHLENVFISHKAKNKVVTNNMNLTKSKRGERKKIELTPRGQLHKETVYGMIKQPVIKEMKVGGKFTLDIINQVTNSVYKQLLLDRLAANDNNAKKAFGGKNSLSKNPIYLDEEKTVTLPESVKLLSYEDCYTIRKDISPELKIDKVIDVGIRRILEHRLKEYNGNAKEAFSDLDKSPIWLNKEKGISIKRVSIKGIRKAEALHYKKDHFGNMLLNEEGNKIPVSFVSTGNNHHVAIYEDAEGNLQEKAVSFYEAVERIRQGLTAVDRVYNQDDGWKFLFTMKQNEMFVFSNEKTGFDPNEIDLIDPLNKKIISLNLFRVQKIATKNYFFRHHLETTVETQPKLKDVTYKSQLGLNAINGIVKVRINHLGDIVNVGEY